MSLNQFFSLYDGSKILSFIKSQLTEMDQHIADHNSEAAIAKMQKIIQALNSSVEKQSNDKNLREAVELVKEKCKVMQEKIPDARVYIMHASFLQQLGLYEESHDHLIKMNENKNSYQMSIKVSDAQSVQISDLLAKIYLRNGAIPGARAAAKQALSREPNHQPALMVLELCRRADVHNNQAKASEKTWLSPFAYLTEKDDQAFKLLGIKPEEIPSYLRCVEAAEEKPAKTIALCGKSFANSPFGFLTVHKHKQNAQPQQQSAATPTNKSRTFGR